MENHDEPILRRDGTAPEPGEDAPLRDRLRRLLEREPYAVLCTQGDGQPYGSVVAFATDDSLAAAVFATGRETRKFRLISGCDRVALVVDSRGRHPDELMSVEAVTATGRVREIEPGEEFDGWAVRLLAKHPALGPFLESPSTALLRVDVVRYLHVHRFQEVRQWIPPAPA
jgi:nitroimidazol reductase NimA-like FMN-containing flavoprotein (pyridoxamine 5'-phosphate oxidase superfamily)